MRPLNEFRAGCHALRCCHENGTVNRAWQGTTHNEQKAGQKNYKIFSLRLMPAFAMIKIFP